MAPKFLKKLGASVPKGSLKHMLHRHLSGYDKGRRMANMHASEMTKDEGICPRFYAIAQQEGITKTPDRWLTTSEQVTFEIGRMLQDRLVHWYADMGAAVGHWKCMACDHVHEFQARPTWCVKCNCKGFKPEEVRFESAISGISCGVDMLIKRKGVQKLTPVEVKSIDKDQFKTLAAPQAEHRIRTLLYLEVIAESAHSWANMVDTSEAVVLYISKGGYGCADISLAAAGLNEKFSPLKEFTLKRDAAHTVVMRDRAKVVKDYRDEKVGMPCGVCATALDKRAKECSLKTQCFSGKYPPTYDWT